MFTYWILFSSLCIGRKYALFVQETFRSSSPYPEVPCGLLPLSSWKSEDGDLWAISSSDIWWHNFTNQTWQSEPLPNITSLPWKVACVIHSCHAVLQTDLHFLIFHTIHRKWHEIDSGPLSTHAVVICQQDIATILDFQTKSVYRLNPVNGITEKTDVDEMPYFTNESEGRMVMWQTRNEGIYVLCHSHLFKTNGTHWVQLAERTNNQWPKFLSRSASWIEGNLLWVWNQADVWAFAIDSRHWNHVHLLTEGSLVSPIATWVENNHLCSIIPKDNCTSSYVITSSWCLHSDEESDLLSSLNSSDGKSTDVVVTQTVIYDSHHTMQSYWHPILSPLHRGSSDSSINGTSVTWQQDHSSGFGPVIFFGTSLSIFGIVAIVWCIRRCVHFPKEALLLRDPPSVRYTAIPEAVA